MTTWVNGMETGLAAGTAVTTANSSANGEGFAWSPTTTTTGTVQTSTTSPLFGTRSVVFAAPVTGDVARGLITGIFTSTALTVDLAFRTPSWPTADIRIIEPLASGPQGFRVNLSAAGRLDVLNAANVGIWSSTSLVSTAATGWRIGFRVVAGTTTTNGRLEFSYYANANDTVATEVMPVVTAGNLGIAAFNEIRFGKITSGGVIGVLAVDGIQISDTRTTLFNSPPTAAATVSAGADKIDLEPWNEQILTATSSTGTVTWSQVSGTTVTIASTGALTASYTYKPLLAGSVSLTFRATNTGATDDVIHTFLPARDWIVISTNPVVRKPVKIRRIVAQGVNATYDTTTYDTNPYG
jgi:hypothetical protein